MQTNPDYEMHLRPEEDYEMHFDDAGLKPEQTATVTPDYETQTVRPDPGCVFSEVTVEAIPEPTEEIDITENGVVDVARYGVANVAVPVGVFPEGTENISQNGDYDVTLKETAHVDVVPDLQDKTVTPTEQTQTIEADAGYDGLDAVTVNPIPQEYVVPSGSVDITANGTVPVSGKAEANVNVPQGVFPSGTKVITENVIGEDVTNYAAVDVAVPGPSGTKQISITANGTTTEDVANYADAEITVNTLPAKGLVFEDYDSDGFPHSARFVGFGTTIPSGYARYIFQGDCKFASRLEVIVIPEGITSIGSYAMQGGVGIVPATLQLPNSLTQLGDRIFRGVSIQNILLGNAVETIGTECLYGLRNEIFTLPATLRSIGASAMQASSTKEFIFMGQAPNLPFNFTTYNNKAILYDFSHCTSIPPLYNVASLGHSSGCVIRIPAALSDTTLGEGNGWESATNWSALTNIVWEVV